MSIRTVSWRAVAAVIAAVVVGTFALPAAGMDTMLPRCARPDPDTGVPRCALPADPCPPPVNDTTTTTSTTTTTAPLLDERIDFRALGRGRLEMSEPPAPRSLRFFELSLSAALKDGDDIYSGSLRFGLDELSFGGEGEATSLRRWDALLPKSVSLLHAVSEDLLTSGEVESGQLLGFGLTYCGGLQLRLHGRSFPVDISVRVIADPSHPSTGAVMLELATRF